MLSAQTLPKEVFDAEGCGCTAIDIDKVLQGDAEHIASINVNKDLLLATFKANRNEIAQQIIVRLADPNAGLSLQKRLVEFNKALGPKKDGKKEEWLAEFNAIAAKANKNIDKVGLYMACKFAEKLHTYYLQYPEDASPEVAKEFYSRYAAFNPVIVANNTTTTTDTTAIATTEILATQPQGQTPWFWICVGIGSMLVAAYLFASRPRDLMPELLQLREDLEANRTELLKLREKLGEKDRETEALSRSNGELKNMVAYLERQRQQKINVTPPTKDEDTSPKA
jgi:IS1 family transposase